MAERKQVQHVDAANRAQQGACEAADRGDHSKFRERDHHMNQAKREISSRNSRSGQSSDRRHA